MRYQSIYFAHKLLPVPNALTDSALAAFLVDSGLISGEAVISGDVKFRDASRRNHNIEVIAGEASYFIKCAVGQERHRTQSNEAAAYALIWEAFSNTDPRTSNLPPVPRLRLHDPGQGILVLDRFSGGNVRDHYVATNDFAENLAAAAGTAIARVHRMLPAAEFGAADLEPPWALSAVHHPDLRVLRDLSLGNLQLVKAIQSDKALVAALDNVGETWRTDHLIHGDFKWDNCLVQSVDGTVYEASLVDWELSTFGDSAWDTGSFLSEFASAWVFSMPAHGSLKPQQLPGLAEWPLQTLQPSIRAFWDAYSRERMLTERQSVEFLLESIRYAAVRLVQTAFEHLQPLPVITTAAVLLLQLSANILASPEKAAVQIFGLGLGESSA